MADFDDHTIDAAVLEVRARDWPSGLHALGVSTLVAPGDAVEFDDRAGTTVTGTVARVFRHATYWGNLLGQRVIADCHGVSGDSGSLLVNSVTSEAAGLYIGRIPDGRGGFEGMFQDMLQAQNYFNLKLFR